MSDVLINWNGYVIGYTDDQTVMLDLDHTTLKKAKKICEYLHKRYKLEGYIIMKSSRNSFHTIFNKPCTYRKVLSIIAMAVWIYKKKKLQDWFILQALKGLATLRVTPKKDRPLPPKLIYSQGLQDKKIKEYFETYNLFNYGIGGD